MGDQSVARQLPTHRTAQTQNKHTDIHASSGILTHDHGVRAGEDSSCLRPCGHCDRLPNIIGKIKENCMGGTCSTHERDKFLQNVSRKISKE
jgi:hypothetical protein